MKPVNNHIFCPGCRRPKILFETREKAENFIRFNGEEIAVQSGKAPTRSYYCSFCCGWHVTSLDDLEKGKEDDLRDQRKWEAIYELRKKKIGEDSVDKAFKEKSPILYQLMQKCKNELYLTHLQKAQRMFVDLELELLKLETDTRQRKTSDGKLDKFIMRFSELETAFEIIEREDIGHETRRQYLDSEFARDNKVASAYLANREFIVNMDEFVREIDDALDDGDSERFELLCRDMAYALDNYSNKNSREIVKRYREMLVKLSNDSRNKSRKSILPLKKTDRDTYLSIISILEQAYAAVENSDTASAASLLKTAECLMPGKSREAEIIISGQIEILRNKL